MSESQSHSRFPFRSLRVSLITGMSLLAVFLLLNLSSCTTVEDDPEENAPQAKQRCQETLKSAMYMHDPGRLGITSRMEHTVSRINDWALECGKKVGLKVEFKPETKRMLAQILSSEDMKKLDKETFDRRDVRHIRNSLLMRKIVKFASGLSEKDLNRTVDLFYFTIRNIELLKPSDRSFPMPPFRVLLDGRGTAQDRAWIFASLLRQLRISAVILKPNSPAKSSKPADDNTPFLVGVLLNEKVYLFDTRLGLPIPGPNASQETSPLIRQPATLDEFLSNPKIHARLSLEDFQYPIQPKELEKPRVELIGHRSLWSTLMKRLNYSLVGKEKPVLFDELDDDSDGLIGRVATYSKGRWKTEDIRIWNYPEQIFHRFENRTDAEKTQLIELERPFLAPVSYTVDSKTGELTKVSPKRQHLKSRIYQLTGRFQTAIQSYTSVQLESDLDPRIMSRITDNGLKRSLLLAREGASVWSGLCKLEQRELRNAVQSLELHIARFGNLPRAAYARYLLALSHRYFGNYNAANDILANRISRENPQKHGYLLLVRRWREQFARQPRKQQ